MAPSRARGLLVLRLAVAQAAFQFPIHLPRWPWTSSDWAAEVRHVVGSNATAHSPARSAPRPEHPEAVVAAGPDAPPRVVAYDDLRPRGACPPGNPDIKRLRRATHAANERALTFLAWVPSQSTHRMPPLPVMSSKARLERVCAEFYRKVPKQWGFCPGAPASEHARYSCESAAYVAELDCAYVDCDAHEHIKPGLVYDHSAAYAVHLASGQFGRVITRPGAGSTRVKAYPELAHALGVYPRGTAHAIEQLPRLVMLLRTLPAHVPIVAPRHSLREQFVAVLDVLDGLGCLAVGAAGQAAASGAGRAPRCSGARVLADGRTLADRLLLLPRTPVRAAPAGMAPVGGNVSSRLVWWDQLTTYRADRVFFAGESVWVPAQLQPIRPQLPPVRRGWYDMLDEAPCHYKRLQPMWLLQSTLTPAFVRPRAARYLKVLIVHRAEAKGRRVVANHDDLERAVRRALPHAHVYTFVGRQHALGATVSLFANADIAIAPHGAACAFWAFMRPRTAVVELAYPGHGGMWFPANFYYLLAHAVGLRYHLSLCTSGNYNSPMRADVGDVVRLVQMAAGALPAERGRPPAGGYSASAPGTARDEVVWGRPTGYKPGKGELMGPGALNRPSASGPARSHQARASPRRPAKRARTPTPADAVSRGDSSLTAPTRTFHRTPLARLP